MLVARLALLAFVACATASPVRRQTTLPSFYQPSPIFEEVTLAPVSGALERGALAFIATKLGVGSGAVSAKVTSSFTDASTGVSHVHAVQTISGIPVANAVANVNVKNSKVLSYGSSFVTVPSKIPSAVPALGAADAVVALAKALQTTVNPSKLSLSDGAVAGAGFAIGDIKASLKWYALSTGGIELAWSLETELPDSWLDAYVSAVTGAVLGVVDRTSHSHVNEGAYVRTAYDVSPQYAEMLRSLKTRQVETSVGNLQRRQSTASYNYFVVPAGKANPPEGMANVTNPADLSVSPLGWHDVGNGPVAQTIGNNVKAVSNVKGDYPINVATFPLVTRNDFNFVYPVDLNLDPKNYTNASVVNVFYSINYMHDLTYKYGFDEVSGNFQTDNFGKGGAQGDAIIAIAQDYEAFDNADFSSPADGTFGRMRMYPFTKSTPRRDGGMEHPIVHHEFCHGVSNRLTGGPANANCLASGEPGGLGEGWSDVCGYISLVDEKWNRSTDLAIGSWNLNTPTGVRKYKYSTNTATNPLMYASINSFSGIYDFGTTWATLLYEVLANFVEAYGYKPLLSGPSAESGNTKFFRLVIAGMKLQPCSPNFITARNAIIQADVNIYNGANKCILWKGFAKRGLGFSATTSKSNKFDLPSGC
ncbi:Fungalysin metallopeptidase-domain-containing protein [Cladochytrium replicatum]|nr:Fungalysin metallopeptidase-domain-containing protein [Cladochytrium replicatum]